MKNTNLTAYNKYYYADLQNLIKTITVESKNVAFLSSHDDLVKIPKEKADYYVLVNLIGKVDDAQLLLQELRKTCIPTTRILIIYYNYLWEPLLKLAQILGLKGSEKEQNWLALEDIGNLLSLSDFSVVKRGRKMLFPLQIPFISTLLNKYLAKMPFINKFCLTNYIVARPVNFKNKELSVSVIVPARNEAGTIEKLLQQLPPMGKWMEVIFVEGHSKDKTWEAIQLMKEKYKNLRIKSFKQKGRGKADAVHLGLKHAKGEIIIILDADLSVAPSDLPKFYDALMKGYGEFANGSRLVYPLEKESMRFLNKIGNKFFSLMFSWILNQRFTDTLCGSKAFFKKDYRKILNLRKIFGHFDPFGDYELIFGASKLNLKVVEIPVKYHPRTYGKTNISRFTHGFLLLKMCLFAIRKLKWE